MKEIRTCEIRAAATAEAGALLIQGTPIVYDQPTTIQGQGGDLRPAGPFTEVIRRGALDGADVSDVRLLYNHDLNKVPLARTPRTMRLEVTPAGMSVTATLPDTEEARSVHTAVSRGDLTGMSFAFKVPAGGDRYDPATRTREIMKIEKVLECSIVPFPAYPQTSVEARAAIQEADGQRAAARIKINQIIRRV